MVRKRGGANMLAKVTVVDSNGDILLDTFAAPTKPVVDYRTVVNGIPMPI
jgi:RNA exonuclease 4